MKTAEQWAAEINPPYPKDYAVAAYRSIQMDALLRAATLIKTVKDLASSTLVKYGCDSCLGMLAKEMDLLQEKG